MFEMSEERWLGRRQGAKVGLDNVEVDTRVSCRKPERTNLNFISDFMIQCIVCECDNLLMQKISKIAPWKRFKGLWYGVCMWERDSNIGLRYIRCGNGLRWSIADGNLE